MFANAYLISGSNSSKLERETCWLIGCGKSKASPLLSGATQDSDMILNKGFQIRSPLPLRVSGTFSPGHTNVSLKTPSMCQPNTYQETERISCQ